MPNAVWTRLAELSEQDLRTQILIPMLERTPGVEQVTDVHGANERGLDIVFFTVDQIRRTCFGVQVKRGDISGGGSRERTVSQIIDQLNLATHFKHPVAIQPSGEYRIERFIVAANGRISATAREEIGRRVDPISTDFWDLSEIVRRASSVYPEVLQTADPQVISYLKYVEARCETLDALDQVTGIERHNLSDVFVEPSLRRRFDPTLADSDSGASHGHRHSVPALSVVDQGHDLVLIGEQNEGKTSILRMTAITRAQRLLNGDAELDEAGQIPVPVRATSLLSVNTVRAAVAEALKKGGAKDRARDLQGNGSLKPYLVLLDGFSELPDDESRRRCAHIIELAAGEDGPRLVVAARPDDFLRPGLFDTFSQYTITDFDQQQVRALVQKWTKDTVEFADVAEKMIDRLRSALQLPGSPIPAIIGVMLYEKEQKFITNTAEAVDRYMVIRLGRYATEMDVRMEVDWQRKQDLLAEVAFAMVAEGIDRIGVSKATEIMDRVYTRLGEPSSSSTAISELVHAGVLDSDREYLSFYRTAFRDFFAAKYVASRHESFDSFFIDRFFDRRWGQVLVFAAGLRRHNSQLLVELDRRLSIESEQLSVGDSEDDLYGAYLLGRVLSNSDAADKEPRVAVLRTTVRAVANSVDSLAEEAERQFGKIGQVVALVGTEHTMLATIGVPWLAEQLRQLASDAELSEEERYLLMSVYVHLGCDGWIDALEAAVAGARKPRVVAALLMLVHILDLQRHIDAADQAKWHDLRTSLERKRRKLGSSVDRLLKVKGPLLEIEMQRIRRLGKKTN